MTSPDLSEFESLKGEFEAEGLSREAVAIEVAWAARRGADYLVKIGGCEAKADVAFLRALGVTSLVAPMIESAFAMSKYMGLLREGDFRHVGVTIETITAVERIEAILDAGTLLDNVTVGRSDLTGSFGGAGVDAPETVDMVRTVARAARARGLSVTMGGGINARTRDLLRADGELAGLLDSIETRKVVMSIESFLRPGILERAIETELALLDLHAAPLRTHLTEVAARADAIRSRL